MQVPTIGSLEQSQYLYCGLENLNDDPPQPPQHSTTTSRSTKCSQVDMKSAIKEHPLAIALIIITLTMFILGIGVGFGVNWQGSEGDCICEEGEHQVSFYAHGFPQ